MITTMIKHGAARTSAAFAALALVVAACGGGSGGEKSGDASPSTTEAAPSGLVAQVASYDLVADRDQRVIVGLQSAKGAKLVSFGTVDLAFEYLGTEERPEDPAVAGPTATGEFVPIPGQTVTTGTGPRFVAPSEGIGVYRVPSVRFDRAGSWRVKTTAVMGGKTLQATGPFTVRDVGQVPAPGEQAPRTQNHLPGTPDAPPKAVDSRAEPDGTVPDPELHDRTVADAITAGRPTMVVISTPVYCESRFCGPVTDSVQALAREYGERMSFVHLEVWRDFDKSELNKAAAEWIYRAGAEDAQEPWVFVIDGDGTIVERFDNVASDQELRDAVEQASR